VTAREPLLYQKLNNGFASFLASTSHGSYWMPQAIRSLLGPVYLGSGAGGAEPEIRDHRVVYGFTGSGGSAIGCLRRSKVDP